MSCPLGRAATERVGKGESSGLSLEAGAAAGRAAGAAGAVLLPSCCCVWEQGCATLPSGGFSFANLLLWQRFL